MTRRFLLTFVRSEWAAWRGFGHCDFADFTCQQTEVLEPPTFYHVLCTPPLIGGLVSTSHAQTNDVLLVPSATAVVPRGLRSDLFVSLNAQAC